jgi:hypothetical protein
MTQDEIIKMTRQLGICELTSKPKQDIHYSLTIHEMEAFAKLVAQHEREACAYWAGIALLGADRGLSNRVDQAIRARGQA